MTKRALVIGGGIAGIQAALDIADGGHKVVLVEKRPSIGGHMSQLSETFPTLDCSQCILTPRMVEAARHPDITLHDLQRGGEGRRASSATSRSRSAEGPLGGREALHRLRRLLHDQVPATRRSPSEFDAGLGSARAIYVPFPQAVPNKPVHRHAPTAPSSRPASCKALCAARIARRGAIDFEQRGRAGHLEVGAIVLATGFKL